jgi:hypothetical protein
MYSVYQHWDPLKTCIVGKSYPPEFYSWIKNSKARSVFERIAEETEEDYQSLIGLLKKFNVEVLRPDIPSDSELLFDVKLNSYIPPPMTPRDYTGMYGGDFFHSIKWTSVEEFYNNIKSPNWDNNVTTFGDLKQLPKKIQDEINDVFWDNYYHFSEMVSDDEMYISPMPYKNILKHINDNSHSVNRVDSGVLAGASTMRIGKDIYCNSDTSSQIVKSIDNSNTFDKYRMHHLDINVHTDGVFCPVVPGLIISLHDIPTYKDTFPDWEVVYLPDQSWDKVRPFLDLKKKNKGKWWIPGEEYNNDVIEVVDTWLSKWVGYVEESVFDVNMLVIDEKNVVVTSYNKQVFDALERYGVTPHICNFRHRYFWDGGLHCNTSDLDREGEMKDYFPERG